MAVTTRLVTYVATISECQAALAAGIDTLLLEHSDWSIACEHLTESDPVNHINTLAACARELAPGVRISVVIDALLRPEALTKVIAQLPQLIGIDELRAHDPGLLRQVAELCPQWQRCQTGTWGNVHALALQAWADHPVPVQRMQLANDWDRAALAEVLPQRPLACELPIHGPVLMQYSDRRQVSAWYERDNPDADPDLLPPRQQELILEGRKCRMTDNQHGMLLWGDSDRCLYQQFASVKALNLDGLVIDARNYPPALQDDIWRQYRAALDGDHTWAPDLAVIERWREQHQRLLKPGFFLANNTDATFRHKIAARQVVTIGKVIDVIKSDSVVVQLELPAGDAEHFVTVAPPTSSGAHPEQRFSRQSATNLNGGQPEWQPGDLIVWPWVKGVVVNSPIRPVD